MIRRATENDIPEMLRMAETFIAQTSIEWSPAYVASQMFNSLGNKERLLLVLDHGGVVGMLIAGVDQSPLAPMKVAHELVFWIDADHRGGRWALKMLDEYITWATSHHCRLVHMAGRDERVERLYSRRGFEPMERHYGLAV